MKLVTITSDLMDFYGYTIPDSYNISKDDFIDFICSLKSVRNGAMGLSSIAWSKFIKIVFPDKNNGRRYIHWLLNKSGMEYCYRCKEVYFLEDFYKNPTKLSGVGVYCKLCALDTNKKGQVARTAKYRAAKLQRSPKWLTEEQFNHISEFYKNCPEGNHVDHVVPLQGNLVSGLHVPWNLQYLLASDNLTKSNLW